MTFFGFQEWTMPVLRLQAKVEEQSFAKKA